MLLMDGDKKRKRSTENGEVNGGGGDRCKHEVESSVKEEKNTVVLPPSPEAEVDEFFAILRRMHVAVKYLQRSAQVLPENVNAQSSKLTASPASSNGVTAGRRRSLRIVRKVGLDLNTLPDGGD